MSDRRVWRCKVCGLSEAMHHADEHAPEMELVSPTPDPTKVAQRLIYGFMLDCNAGIGLLGAAENLARGIKEHAATLGEPRT